MSREVFISHAVKDKVLADAIVDLVQLGLNVGAERIFCSSLEGLGIPSGVNFVDHIKAQIQSPKAVIALITPNYLASQFCLCELGATWAMSHRLFPLLVPPLKYAAVQGVLTGVQLTALDSSERLSELRDQLLATLSINGAPTARWEVKRDKFLKELPRLLKKLPTPETISSAEHAKVKSDLSGAKDAIAELETDRERLTALVDELSSAKDQKEVARIKKAHQPAADILEQLEQQLAASVIGLPKCVSFVACKELGLDQAVKVDLYKDKDFYDQIGDAADLKLVEISDEGACSLNSKHPKIKDVIQAYDELAKFLETVPPEIEETFEAEHQMPLSLGNRAYWEWAIDQRIKKVYA